MSLKQFIRMSGGIKTVTIVNDKEEEVYSGHVSAIDWKDMSRYTPTYFYISRGIMHIEVEEV